MSPARPSLHAQALALLALSAALCLLGAAGVEAAPSRAPPPLAAVPAGLPSALGDGSVGDWRICDEGVFAVTGGEAEPANAHAGEEIAFTVHGTLGALGCFEAHGVECAYPPSRLHHCRPMRAPLPARRPKCVGRHAGGVGGLSRLSCLLPQGRPVSQPGSGVPPGSRRGPQPLQREGIRACQALPARGGLPSSSSCPAAHSRLSGNAAPAPMQGSRRLCFASTCPRPPRRVGCRSKATVVPWGIQAWRHGLHRSIPAPCSPSPASRPLPRRPPGHSGARHAALLC